jgi:heme exporter protein A
LNIPVRQLSAGQKRKVSLARLLISKSKLWLLDEPDASLDEDNKKLLNKIMVNHLIENGAIVIATHTTIDIKNVLPIDITRFKNDKNTSIDQFVDGFNK